MKSMLNDIMVWLKEGRAPGYHGKDETPHFVVDAITSIFYVCTKPRTKATWKVFVTP